MHSFANMSTSTCTPFSFNFLILFPLTLGLGSLIPINTLGILYFKIKSEQGGVFPKCEQGSKVTYKLHSVKRSLFLTELIALTSA